MQTDHAETGFAAALRVQALMARAVNEHATTQEAMTEVLASLKPGDRVEVVYTTSSGAASTVRTVSTVADGKAYLEQNGKQRSGRVAGGMLAFRPYDRVMFQASLYMQVRAVRSLRVVSRG